MEPPTSPKMRKLHNRKLTANNCVSEGTYLGPRPQRPFWTPRNQSFAKGVVGSGWATDRAKKDPPELYPRSARGARNAKEAEKRSETLAGPSKEKSVHVPDLLGKHAKK